MRQVTTRRRPGALPVRTSSPGARCAPCLARNHGRCRCGDCDCPSVRCCLAEEIRQARQADRARASTLTVPAGS